MSLKLINFLDKNTIFYKIGIRKIYDKNIKTKKAKQKYIIVRFLYCMLSAEYYLNIDYKLKTCIWVFIAICV